MCPGGVEGNGFLIGVKPVSAKGGTDAFKGVERFTSSFNFVIAFPLDWELALLLVNSIFQNLFNFSYFLSRGIDGDRFFGPGLREAGESFEVWSVVDLKMAARNPLVDAWHYRGEVGLVVVLAIRFFRD